MHPLLQLAQQRILFLDGAMGTMLQKKGLQAGESPELWNLTHPSLVQEIHEEYIDAGADIINTNTFGGNGLKLLEYNLQDKLQKINMAGVSLAKKATLKASKKVFVAASIGPVGQFLKPLGPLSFDELSSLYQEQIKALISAGADILNFETMIDLAELRCAILSAKKIDSSIPIFAHLTFTESGRTLTGSDPLTGFNVLSGLGAHFVGMNCGLGPQEMGQLMDKINQSITTPIVIQANAGLPQLVNGETVFTCPSYEYVQQLKKVVQHGVNIIGGCCGTTPQFIKEIIEEFKNEKPKPLNPTPPQEIILSSLSQSVFIGKNHPFVKIGEKINPSALKKVAQDLRTKQTHQIKEVALEQEKAGAHVLDINFGLAGIKEEEVFESIIPQLSAFSKLPFCIDTTHPIALEIALKLYPGRALINSISGEEERLNTILPLMKKYGAYAILLPLDENGIPDSVQGRLKVIERVLNKGKEFGVPSCSFIVDALVMTVSASPYFAPLSLETIKEAYTQFGLSSTCGLSNISFGLPGRNALNGAFLTMLMGAGLDCAILNPQDPVIQVFSYASSVLTLRDENALQYIKKYASVKNFFTQDAKGGQDNLALLKSQEKNQTSNQNSKDDTSLKEITWQEKLKKAILEGQKELIEGFVKEGLNHVAPQEIVNQVMIPSITLVGDLYEKKEYFLPQLMLSAEAMKKGMTLLEPLLKQASTQKLGTIVIATVKGDIHDIGKNIVGIILENYGFEVIDLGKDVPLETIYQEALKNNAHMIALSALMTTTMVEMQKCVEFIKGQKNQMPVMVGGAVVNEAYAQSIGAYYAKDAIGAVEVAKKIMQTLKK